MIRPSQRRRRDARDHAFDLHERLARAEAWHRKLSVAGIAALVASVAAWLLGVELEWHAGAVAAGFVGGLAWPARDAEQRAFGWIADRVGLAYETALQRSSDDPFGLRGAVEERARAAAARLRFPARQRWWMASLALALGLLLLPAARSVAPSGTAGGPEGPNVSAPVAPEPEDEASEVDEPERPEDLERAADPDDRSGDPADGASADGGASRASEEETLSRFLDNLRERDPFDPVDTPPSPQDAAPTSEPGDASPGEPEAREGRSQESEDDPQGDEAQQGGDSEGTPRDGEEQGDQGRPEEGQEEGDSEGAPGPEQGDGEGSEERDVPSAGLEPGDETGEPQPDASEGTGADPSSIRPSGDAEGDSQEDPEFLQGQLEAGPENPGGSVLLPGESDVDVPSDLRSDDYRRAVEEAVIDGQVPLEYQEIIRNYFR